MREGNDVNMREEIQKIIDSIKKEEWKHDFDPMGNIWWTRKNVIVRLLDGCIGLYVNRKPIELMAEEAERIKSALGFTSDKKPKLINETILSQVEV